MAPATAPVLNLRSRLQPGDTREAADLDPGDVRPAAVEERLDEGAGFTVVRRLVPHDVVDEALRLLNLEIVRRGLTPEEISRCSHSTFFPHLRWEREVMDLRTCVERLVAPRPGEEWADAQLLLRFPDEAQEWPLTPHVDGPPPWGSDRGYRAIVGVALSPSRAVDGCVAVWPGSHVGVAGEPVRVELDPGDVVVMHPDLGHSSTLNRGGKVRYAAYFRLLRDRCQRPERDGKGAGGRIADASA